MKAYKANGDSDKLEVYLPDKRASARLKEYYHTAKSNLGVDIDEATIISKFFAIFDVKSCRKRSDHVDKFPDYAEWNGKNIDFSWRKATSYITIELPD